MSASTDHIGPIEIAEDILGLVKPDLHPGERLLWASRPGPRFGDRRRGSTRAKVVWSVALVFLTVACVYVVRSSTDSPLVSSITGLAGITGFVSAVAAFFVAGNLVVDMVNRIGGRQELAGHVYALTDRRAMIWVPVPRSDAVKVHTFPRGSIKGDDLHRVQYPDGSGDLLFRAQYHDPAGYFDVAEVRRVEDLVRRFLIDFDPIQKG